MASRTANRRVYEERDAGSSAPMLIVAAVALFGLAVLLVYICVASPQQGTSMGAIRDVLYGLGGSLAVALPLVLAWAGALCIGAARGMRLSPLRIAADALLMLCLYTAVHLFFVERICRERMTIMGYANFVSKSYGYGAGGGALGALLAWPLYRNLGVAGGFIATLLIAVLLLTATGRMGRFVRFVGSRSQARGARENDERQFDEIDRPRVRPARNASRDPFSESVLGGADVPADKPRRRAVSQGEDGFNGRPARAANQPTRRRRPAAEPMEEAAPRRRPAGGPRGHAGSPISPVRGGAPPEAQEAVQRERGEHRPGEGRAVRQLRRFRPPGGGGRGLRRGREGREGREEARPQGIQAGSPLHAEAAEPEEAGGHPRGHSPCREGSGGEGGQEDERVHRRSEDPAGGLRGPGRGRAALRRAGRAEEGAWRRALPRRRASAS